MFFNFRLCLNYQPNNFSSVDGLEWASNSFPYLLWYTRPKPVLIQSRTLRSQRYKLKYTNRENPPRKPYSLNYNSPIPCPEQKARSHTPMFSVFRSREKHATSSHFALQLLDAARQHLHQPVAHNTTTNNILANVLSRPPAERQHQPAPPHCVQYH